MKFVTEPIKAVAGKVVLTIGANFGLVDGNVTELDAPAFIEEGRTFVPVRFLAEAFGAEADWTPKDAPVETVTLTTDDMEIVIGIGDEFLTVTKDGEAEVMTFDGAARNQGRPDLSTLPCHCRSLWCRSRLRHRCRRLCNLGKLRIRNKLKGGLLLALPLSFKIRHTAILKENTELE